MTAQKHRKDRPTHADPRTLRLAKNIRTELVTGPEQAEFEASVAAHGVLIPLLVREAEDGVIEVLAGQRRLAAALKAEDEAADAWAKAVDAWAALPEDKRGPRPDMPSVQPVPIAWTTMEDDQVTVVQLIENIHRSDMSLQDTANAVWSVYEGPANGVAKIVSELIGKPKGWVSKMLLLNAPGKSNKVAKRLMAADKLHDIEMAYTLCQIEELSPADADKLAEDIEAQSRASLTNALRQLQAASDEHPAGSGDESGKEGQNEPGSEDPGEPDPAPFVWELEDYEMLVSILKDAPVPSKWMDRKLRMLRAVEARQAQAIKDASGA